MIIIKSFKDTAIICRRVKWIGFEEALILNFGFRFSSHIFVTYNNITYNSVTYDNVTYIFVTPISQNNFIVPVNQSQIIMQKRLPI